MQGSVALFGNGLITGLFNLVKSAGGRKHLFDVIWSAVLLCVLP